MLLSELQHIDEHIEKRGDHWVVTNKDRTKVLGEHPTQAEALRQLAAIEASKRQRLKEGRALDVDTPTVEEIAAKHGVPTQKILDQLKVGIKVEREHTTDAAVAREIALDHLAELPDYYTRLKQVEQ